jgi:eukaryotic-like serine/threonine-protein kinase
MTSRLDPERWRAASPHLDQALDLSDEARAEWLKALRARDAALAADVEALLQEHDEAREEGFLDGESMLPPGHEPFPASVPGDRLGPYRIVRELGRGGTSRVYLAVREGAGFQRQVALKVVDRGISADIERRFRDECRILAGLEHPGIARLYDAGRAPDGRWFLALEYVEGRNLLEHTRRPEVTTEEKLRLFLSVVDAVAFAHARSVVHRDLKPGNILVGADGRPLLLDFGIAKLLDPDSALPPTETRTEFRALTPAYASPEQFRGQRVTTASDIFSLGVILYEMLAGVRPFGSASSSRSVLEKAVLTEEPEPPSAAARRAPPTGEASADATATGRRRPRGPRLGRDLDAICLKALRKEPDRRYASATAFAEDLRSHLAGRRVGALTGSGLYRMTRFLRRHRAGLATAAALLVAAASILTAASVYRRSLPPAPPVPRPFPIWSTSKTPIEELQRRFAAAPASVEAGAALAMALLRAERGPEARVIVERLRQIPGREQDPLTDYVDGYLSYRTGQPQRALVLYTRARDTALATGRGELLGQIRAGRGRLLTTLGQRAEARAEMERARAEIERAGDRPSLVRVLNDLSIEYFQLGEFERAEAMLERALRETRALGNRGGLIQLNLAVAYLDRGRPDLAEQRIREVVAEGRQEAPDKNSGWAVGALADALRERGQRREADERLDEAIELTKKFKYEPVKAELLCERGLVDLGRGRFERLPATIAEIEATATVEGGTAGLGLGQYLRGRVAAERGDVPAARHHLAEASRLLAASGESNRATDSDLALAEVERNAGDATRARQLVDLAAGRMAKNGAGYPVGFLAPALRARLDAEAGRVAEARRGLAGLGEDAERSPSLTRRLAFLSARAALAAAERRFGDAQHDLEAARRDADAAGRRLSSLNLRLDEADLERRAGHPERARADARRVAAEARALGFTALAARARAAAAAPA